MWEMYLMINPRDHILTSCRNLDYNSGIQRRQKSRRTAGKMAYNRQKKGEGTV